MDINDSALDNDTDIDEAEELHQQSGGSGIQPKSARRKRPDKNTRNLHKLRGQVNSGRIISESTVSIPVSADIPPNDHVIPNIPQIYARFVEDEYHGLTVGHHSGIVGFHHTTGFWTFSRADNKWYPYTLIPFMRYKVTDQIMENGYLRGYQIHALAFFGSDPFETRSLVFGPLKLAKVR